jgi:hypothetical protein
MIKTWRVRLRVSRDDGAPLEGEAVSALATALSEASLDADVAQGEDHAVLVELSTQARTDRDAITTAERTLRAAADQVWLARGLPPFTISDGSATESVAPEA